MKESKALKILFEELGVGFSVAANGRFRSPLGDDCAVLKPDAGLLVWTNDACGEGSHFLRAWLTPEQVAQKSFHAALSDIPAMGARPQAALCHLGLSRNVDARWLRRFARAQAKLGKESGAPIVGGNISSTSRLEIVTSVLGSISGRPITRDGAKVGDELWLVGDVGLARAGLLILERKLRTPRGKSASFQSCLRAFRMPQAQVKKGPRMLGRASAMMDVSDGLRRDLRSLAMMSGVCLVVDECLLSASLRPELLDCASALGESSLSLALDGGEDYALLATGPKGKRPRFAKRLGYVEAGEGVLLRGEQGETVIVGGFQHGK